MSIPKTLLILPLAMLISATAHADGNTAPTAPSSLTKVVKNDEGENLLADGFGRTLYVFDRDPGAGSPACNGDCAEVWPPFLLHADEAKSLAAPYGAVIRANRQVQLTYGSRPVYTYAFDRKTGDDQGDGVGGVWHYVEVEAGQ